MKHKHWLNFIAVLALATGLGGLMPDRTTGVQAALMEARPQTATGISSTSAEARKTREAYQTESINVDYIGHNGGPAYAVDVAVAGNYSYVADNWDGGLHIINVADPSSPTEAAFYDSPGFTWGVAVAGSYAYIADGLDGGLRIIDVSDPAAPTETGFYVTPGDGLGVAVSGKYAYVADGTGGLRVIDVSDPANPMEVGSYDTSDIAYDVAVAGNYAYVADAWEGLRIIDVSDPAAPTETGFYVTPGAGGVAVSGNFAYVADWNSGLYIIDISDPANPSEVGFCDTTWSAQDVAVEEGYAYVADGSFGLRVIDVSNPAAPSEAGYYETPYNVSGNARGVAVAENLAYLADGEGGLIVLKYTGLTKTNTVITSDLPDPSQVEEPVSVTFEVTSGSEPSVVAGGVVTVTVAGEAASCTVDLADVSYYGECVITPNAPGTHILTATYSGDDYFLPSSAVAEHEVVEEHAEQSRRIYLPGILRDYCPDFFDDFGNPSSGWEIGEDEFVRYEYLNDEYRILTKNDQYIYFSGAPTCARENYIVEVDARWVGVPGASYGIVFGIEGDYQWYYTFEVNTDYRDFGLWRIEGNNYHTIVPITPSNAIKNGTATNRLKVIRSGNQITLEVNGVTLGTWSDGIIPSKTGVGILSVPYDGEPNSDARFDNFSLSRLNGSTLASGNNVEARERAHNQYMPGTHRKFEAPVNDWSIP